MFVIGITLLLHFKKSDAIKQKVSFSNRVRPNHDLAISIASSNKSKLKIDPAQISKNRESDVYNPEFMYLPDYMNRVQKHLRIKLYHQSPAKDTIECSQILNILSDYDLGIDAVFDAYSLVWEYHHETKLKIESIPDGEFKDMIIAQTHGRSVERFLNRYEIEDTQLIEELLQVSPKVFFGNVITDVGIQEGERLLVD
jgi:hypothetical protein